MVDISVIIVNYNVREFLEQAILSVKNALSDISHEIIVVDNASTDGSVRMVRESFPEVNLIANNSNTGFARANNIAIREARGKYISLLNPDTLVKKDTFSVIIKSFEKIPEAGMIGCKVLNPDGTLQLSCRRSFPTPWVSVTKLIGLSRLFPRSRMFGKYNLTYLNPDEPAEVDAISGSFMTVRKEVADSVGGLDEQYFMYGEDLDWCYEIKRAGWKIMYVPETSIVHYKGESSRQSNLNQLKLFYNAMAIFSEKHFKSYHILTPLWLLKMAIWIRAVMAFAANLVRLFIVPFVDLIFIILSILTAFYLRFGELVELPLFRDYRDYMIICGISSVILIISLFIQGVYPGHRFSVRRSFFGSLWGTVFASLIIFFSRSLAVSRIVIILSAVIQVTALTGWRIIIKFIARAFSGDRYIPFSDELREVRSVIIGTDSLSAKIYQKFKKHPIYNKQIIGLINVGKETDKKPGTDLPIVGDISELLEIIDKQKITDIIFTAESHPYDTIIETIALCHSKRVSFRLVPTSLELIIGKSSVVPIGDVPLLNIEYRFLEGTNRFLKRLIDIVLSGLLIIATFPFYFFVKWSKGLKTSYKLILGELGSPLYLKQVYLDGIPYEKWGRYFPLWFHVLKGEMSFVGSPVFDGSDSFHKRVSFLKPGIISLDSIKYEHMADSDDNTFELTYLKNYSILFDLRIIAHRIIRRKR